MCYFAEIMTQAGADINAFCLAKRNWIVVGGDRSLNLPLNQTSGPRDAPNGVVPPPGKNP